MVYLGMSTKTKRYRTKSSKVYCSEKVCCAQDNTEAVWDCEECESKSCNDCKNYIHARPNKAGHILKEITPIPPEQLCSIASKCQEKNFANIWCDDCSNTFCLRCNDTFHSINSKRRSHRRLTLKDYLARKIALEATRHREMVDEDSGEFESLELALERSIMNDACEKTTSTETPHVVSKSTPDLHHEDDDGSLKFVSVFDNDSDLPKPVKASSDLLPSQQVGENQQRSQLTSSTHSDKSEFSSLPNGMDKFDSALQDFDDRLGLHIEDERFKDCQSFILIDNHEAIRVKDVNELVDKLGCGADQDVKFVSIFGNTGDGKSHTLNHTFFGGKEVFSTSSDQKSCTVGVWAAFNPLLQAVFLDTEGLLGISDNENQRTRLLLKVLAISDVIIYRTRAERLHNDLYRFLGDASEAFMNYFQADLEKVSRKHDSNIHDLGPVAVIFHETTHTDVLSGKDANTPELQLRTGFQKLSRDLKAFAELKYVATKTTRPPTDFKILETAICQQLKDFSKRSPRKPAILFETLQVLNSKFSGDIETETALTFPDQYFTCKSVCLSCGVRCLRSMNHSEDHFSKKRCKFQHQFENKIYLCKKCVDNGEEDCLVLPKTSASEDGVWLGLVKYAASGYVLECRKCGIIYRSRQYWFGNTDPDRGNAVVKTEIRHVWPGLNTNLQGTHNAARRLIDGVHSITDVISSFSAKPTKMMSDWFNDQIAPTYWKPNSEILECHQCKTSFADNDSKHHCRRCGEGFCDECTHYRRLVPERGWGGLEVRVCEKCCKTDPNSDSTGSEGEVPQVTARKVAEGVTGTIGLVKNAVDYPLEYIKDSARPSYWIPDDKIKQCCVCEKNFNYKLKVHHCRACGLGVCSDCSKTSKPVPSRGWDHEVRICDNCANMPCL